MNQLIIQIKLKIAQLQSILGIAQSNLSTPQGKKIFETAKTLLGTDASPNDLAPDEYGCAETVSDVLIASGFPMPVIISTAELYKFFVGSGSWLEVPGCLPGDVIISPTGMGGQNGVLNGHTGIVGENSVIMSNNSYTGRFETNYTVASWTSRYKIKGGYPVFYFRRINS